MSLVLLSDQCGELTSAFDRFDTVALLTSLHHILFPAAFLFTLFGFKIPKGEKRDRRNGD